MLQNRVSVLRIMAYSQLFSTLTNTLQTRYKQLFNQKAPKLLISQSIMPQGETQLSKACRKNTTSSQRSRSRKTLGLRRR